MYHPWITVLVLFSASPMIKTLAEESTSASHVTTINASPTTTTASSTALSTITLKSSTEQDYLTEDGTSNTESTNLTNETVASTTNSSNIETKISNPTTIAQTTSNPYTTSTVPTSVNVSNSTVLPASSSTSTLTVTSAYSTITTSASATVNNGTTTPITSKTSINPTPTQTKATPTTTTHVTANAHSSTVVPTAAPTAPVASSTMTPLISVVISETNLLLETGKDKYFVELQVKQVGPAYVWLAFYNATNFSSPLNLVNFTLYNSDSGFNVFYIEKEVLEALANASSVGIAVYAEKEYAIDQSTEVGKLYDILWYSSQTCISGNKDPHLGGPCMVIDVRKLGLKEVSLSRCSESYSGGHSVLTMPSYAGYHSVLTTQSPNATNNCTLTPYKALEMKLNKVVKACSSTGINSVNDSFQISLVNSLITGVNSLEYCGLAWPMLYDLNITENCSVPNKEVKVKLTVKAAYNGQISSIVEGYRSFNSRPNLTIGQESFTVDGCIENCFSKNIPNPGANDDKMRVTVAVVVSCVGVFLILLLLVVLYMKRKQRGNHQFQMSRLDEEDDLAGDMDDFIGSQGATFRSFK